MSRYIDADALIAELERCSYETWSKGVPSTWWAHAVKIKDNIVACIKRQPTADVAEVRHGEWVSYTHPVCLGGDLYYNCSVCGKCDQWQHTTRGHANYCPNCGAKMDGGNKNAAD